MEFSLDSIHENNFLELIDAMADRASLRRAVSLKIFLNRIYGIDVPVTISDLKYRLENVINISFNTSFGPLRSPSIYDEILEYMTETMNFCGVSSDDLWVASSPILQAEGLPVPLPLNWKNSFEKFARELGENIQIAKVRINASSLAEARNVMKLARRFVQYQNVDASRISQFDNWKQAKDIFGVNWTGLSTDLDALETGLEFWEFMEQSDVLASLPSIHVNTFMAMNSNAIFKIADIARKFSDDFSFIAVQNAIPPALVDMKDALGRLPTIEDVRQAKVESEIIHRELPISLTSRITDENQKREVIDALRRLQCIIIDLDLKPGETLESAVDANAVIINKGIQSLLDKVAVLTSSKHKPETNMFELLLDGISNGSLSVPDSNFPSDFIDGALYSENGKEDVLAQFASREE